MSPIDADQYEIRLTFEDGGAVSPPEGTGWQLWTASAESGGRGNAPGVWLVWYRRKRKGADRG